MAASKVIMAIWRDGRTFSASLNCPKKATPRWTDHGCWVINLTTPDANFQLMVTVQRDSWSESITDPIPYWVTTVSVLSQQHSAPRSIPSSTVIADQRCIVQCFTLSPIFSYYILYIVLYTVYYIFFFFKFILFILFYKKIYIKKIFDIFDILHIFVMLYQLYILYVLYILYILYMVYVLCTDLLIMPSTWL